MYRSYAVVQGIDRFLPVDIYISGCPPRPEALLEALMALQKRVDQEKAVQNLKSDDSKPIAVNPPRGPIIIRGDR